MRKSYVLGSFFLFGLAVVALRAPSARTASGETEVRDLINKRSAAYHNLDAKGLAALETPDFRLVDRFGDNIASDGPEYNERMWAWTFKEIYKGKPAPDHYIVGIHFLTPDVAVVQTANQWQELKLDDGTIIPPHGEVDTFVVLRKQGSWKLAVQTIHNKMGGMGDHPDFGKPQNASTN